MSASAFSNPRLALAAAALVLAAPACAQSEREPLPAEALREFSEVYAIIRNNYVDEVDAVKMMRDAIYGVVDGLDQHSVYLQGEDLEHFNSSIEGRYGGVGLYIGVGDQAIRVIAPIDDSPADEAGMLAGDFIVAIDGAPTADMSVADASNLMRGLQGTVITLDVLRAAQPTAEQLMFVLERARINAPSVRSAYAGEGYGYLRISQFLRSNRTARELAEHLDELYASHGGELSGLVLDLRSNPGGDLAASICVSSMFLPRGMKVVADRGRTYSNEHTSDLTRCPAPRYIDRTRTVNLVILTDRGSASASEIVAGALQDNNRASVVGETTFGKASVQKVIELRATEGRSALKLTSARYYTPSGRSIEGIGIEPDIAVERPEPDERPVAEPEPAPSLGDVDETPFLPEDDPVFERGLEQLRAMRSGQSGDARQG